MTMAILFNKSVEFCAISISGETEKLLDLLLEGYDHLLDLEIDEDIVQEVIKRGHSMTLSLLQSIPTFEVRT
jgi:hypothetical protein